MKTTLYALLVAIALAAAGFAVAARTAADREYAPAGPVWFVSPDGDDAAEGSAETPWRSIRKAAEAATPGTTVFLRGGTYTEEVLIDCSGEKGAPVTFKACEGETPLLDGGNGQGVLDDPVLSKSIRDMNAFLEAARRLPPFNPDQGILRITGSWLVFDGIHITGSPAAGMYFCEGASHIVVQNCSVTHCVAPGICFGAENSPSTDIKVLHNYVYNCSQRSREAISLRTVDTFEVAFNKVELVIKESIDAKSGCRNGTIHHNYVLNSGHCGIYLDAGFPDRPEEENIEIYDNIVENPYGTAICVAAEAGNSISEVRIYNNLVWSVRPENRGCGIKVAKNSDNTDGLIKDIYIYHNTVYGFKQQGIYVNYPQVENIRICNNISANTLNQLAIRDQDVKDPKQIVMDRNLAHGPVSHPGRGLITGDPLFTDPEGGDFTLREGSPAIDTGYKKFSTSHDLTGEVRPQGRAADLGAYEYKRKKK